MKRLGKGTWVLIADGAKALFLENITDGLDPHLQVRRVKTQENPKDIDQSDDRPGRMQKGPRGSASSNPRSALEDTDWHELAEERFAGELADILYRQVHASAFENLVIIAAPRVLGDLRKALHKQVIDRVIAEIPKTLTNHSMDDIEKLVMAEFPNT